MSLKTCTEVILCEQRLKCNIVHLYAESQAFVVSIVNKFIPVFVGKVDGREMRIRNSAGISKFIFAPAYICFGCRLPQNTQSQPKYTEEAQVMALNLIS